MSDAKPGEIPEELKAMMDAEFEIEGLETAAIEQRAREVVAKFPGVEDVGRIEGKLTLRYDVEQAQKAEIRAALEQAGLRVLDVAAAPASPVDDAAQT